MNWSITNHIGGKIAPVKPVFSLDKKYLIAVTSLDLQVYQISSKRCIRRIPLDTKCARDLYIDPLTNLIWLCTSISKVYCVDWQNSRILVDKTLDCSVDKFLSVLSPNEIIVALDDGRKGRDEFQRKGTSWTICKINLESEERIKLSYIKGAKLFTVSSKRDFYALHILAKSESSKERSTILVGKLVSENEVEERRFSARSSPASLAVSDDGTVAFGSQGGTIEVIYPNSYMSSNREAVAHDELELSDDEEAATLPDKYEHAVRTVLKWHIDTVSALAFALDGTYLLSGGKEKVLVLWQLGTSQKQFLPRLTSDISSIEVEPTTSELYALHLDNEILVLSAIDLKSRLQVCGVKAQFTKLPKWPESVKARALKLGNKKEHDEKVGNFSAQLYTNPSNPNHIYLASKTRLQIYDIEMRSQLSMLAMARELPTGKVRSEAHIAEPSITKLAFSADGRWMVVVDETRMASPDMLLSTNDTRTNLSFWQYQKTKTGDEKWRLNTRVSAPHGDNISLLSLVACPDTKGSSFITAAEDGSVRLWTLNIAGSNAEKGWKWSAAKMSGAIGSLKSSSVVLAVSPDGSVIALAFDTTIFLFNRELQIVKSLPNILAARARTINFIGGKLVALSKTRLVVYDIVTDKQLWAYQMDSPLGAGRLLAVDSRLEKFALAVNYVAKDYRTMSKFYVFGVGSPLPEKVELLEYAVSAVTCNHASGDFLVLDVNSSIFELSPGAKKEVASSEEEQERFTFSAHIESLLEASQQSKAKQEAFEKPIDKVLNAHSFDDALYDITDGLDAMFDRVMGLVA